MSEQYNVLIVEDDFRIAQIHQQFIEKNENFIVKKSVRTGAESLAYLMEFKQDIHLIFLDIYIPDVEGLDLFWEIKKIAPQIDIVVVTAAKEVETISGVFRGGIFDYILKPVDANRFEQTLKRYEQYDELLVSKKMMEQEEVDVLMNLKASSPSQVNGNDRLPKGIDPITLEEVKHLFIESNASSYTAAQLSKEIGTSRSTARRYLEYLVSVNEIETKLIYGTVGRPERQYIS